MFTALGRARCPCSVTAALVTLGQDLDPNSRLTFLLLYLGTPILLPKASPCISQARRAELSRTLEPVPCQRSHRGDSPDPEEGRVVWHPGVGASGVGDSPGAPGPPLAAGESPGAAVGRSICEFGGSRP